ncbi:MAG: hypothetical protein O7A04_08055 [Acidobacteria bacterium]|nr:hypothetical protein [Acidobacteriota bacterium]
MTWSSARTILLFGSGPARVVAVLLPQSLTQRRIFLLHRRLAQLASDDVVTSAVGNVGWDVAFGGFGALVAEDLFPRPSAIDGIDRHVGAASRGLSAVVGASFRRSGARETACETAGSTCSARPGGSGPFLLELTLLTLEKFLELGQRGTEPLIECRSLLFRSAGAGRWGGGGAWFAPDCG